MKNFLNSYQVWGIVSLLFTVGCVAEKTLCEKICEPFVNAEDDWADDNCGGLDDSLAKVTRACENACSDTFADLSGGDKQDVKECFDCVLDDTGSRADYDDLNDALTDNCLDECEDEDVGDFVTEFTDEWWSDIDYEDPDNPDCGGGGPADPTGGPQAMHVQVFDTNGLPVQGAQISINGTPLNKTTAFNGTLDETTPIPGSTMGIRVSAPGYVDNVQAITPGSGTDRLVISAPLAPVGITQTINPTAPAPISHNGATVTFQPNTFVDRTGVQITASIDVSFTLISPGSQLAAVGNFLIKDRPDEVLVSLGVVAISAVSAGAEVQLAPGATASVSIPADTGGVTPTDLPPLWRRNPDTGYWEQDQGQWILQGNEWIAQVDALATWNCDYPNRVTCVSGALVSPDGFPLAGVSVNGYMSGQAANFLPASTVQTAITGSDGAFCMEVVPNSNLDISVTCPGGVKMSFDPMTVPELQGARCSGGGCTDLGTSQACCYTDADCDATMDQKCINGTCKAPDRCDEQQVAGQDTPETRVVELGAACGNFTFGWETFSQQDQIVVTYEGATLFDSTCIGANGSESLSFCGTDTTITVSVNPNCAGGTGTEWNFTVSCPF